MAKKIETNSNSNKVKNKTVSEDLLESVRGALFKLKNYLDNIDFTDEDSNSDKKATTMMSVIEKMGKSFETLAILEAKVQKDEQVSSKIRGGSKLSLLEGDEI